MVGTQLQGVRVEMLRRGIEVAGGPRKHCWYPWGPYAGEGLGTPPGEGDESDFLTTSQVEKRKTLLSGSQV